MTDVLDPPAKPDGRSARAAKTKASLLWACRSYMQSGIYRPDMAAVAKKAGVSMRSGFQHFAGVDGLWREALADNNTFDAIAAHIFGQGTAIELAPYVTMRAVRAAVLNARHAGN